MLFETIYDESYQRVIGRTCNGRTFFEAFYDNFLASSPEVRCKFEQTDMQAQARMIKKSFYSLLVFYASNHADTYIHKIALAHDRCHLDIRPELYDLWLENLLKTVAVFDDHYCDDTELAWRLVMTPGIVYMKFRYDHQAQH